MESGWSFRHIGFGKGLGLSYLECFAIKGFKFIEGSGSMSRALVFGFLTWVFGSFGPSHNSSRMTARSSELCNGVAHARLRIEGLELRGLGIQFLGSGSC